MAPRKDGLPKKRRKDYSPVCTKCGGERDSSNPNSPWCKAYRAAYMREHIKDKDIAAEYRNRRAKRKADPELYPIQLEGYKKWRLNNPEKYRISYRNSRIKGKFGITADDYDAMLQEQNGQCAICRASEEIMYLDHDHSSGSLRAFLCSRCNMGIGQFRDSSELLAKAAIYLEQHEQKKEVV